MKSELAQKLKTLLDETSQEEFDKSWNEIVKLNLPSSFEEVLQNRIKELEKDGFIDAETKKKLIKENKLINKRLKLL